MQVLADINRECHGRHVALVYNGRNHHNTLFHMESEFVGLTVLREKVCEAKHGTVIKHDVVMGKMATTFHALYCNDEESFLKCIDVLNSQLGEKTVISFVKSMIVPYMDVLSDAAQFKWVVFNSHRYKRLSEKIKNEKFVKWIYDKISDTKLQRFCRECVEEYKKDGGQKITKKTLKKLVKKRLLQNSSAAQRVLYATHPDNLTSNVNSLKKAVYYYFNWFLLNGWADFFASTWDMLQLIDETLSKTEIVHPALKNVFNAFIETRRETMRVVIVGQDPYFNTVQVSEGNVAELAHGLAFSVRDGLERPSSLKNIFKELTADGFSVSESSSDLTPWARDGVFLINTALTTGSSAGEHSELWRPFTDKLLKKIADESDGLVVVLWGNHAASYENIFHAHTVIKSTHPSGLSANKKTNRLDSFIGSRPFSRINAELTKMGKEIIDWNLDF